MALYVSNDTPITVSNVTQGDSVVSDATVSVVVSNSAGSVVVSSTPLTAQGSGVYTLTVPAATAFVVGELYTFAFALTKSGSAAQWSLTLPAEQRCD